MKQSDPCSVEKLKNYLTLGSARWEATSTFTRGFSSKSTFLVVVVAAIVSSKAKVVVVVLLEPSIDVLVVDRVPAVTGVPAVDDVSGVVGVEVGGHVVSSTGS